MHFQASSYDVADTMSVDFLDLFSDSELLKIPAEARQFLKVDHGPSMGESTWGYFAYGFSAGFEQLAMQAWKEWPRREYLRLPVLYLCRHSIELSIKAAIEDCAGYTGKRYEVEGHNLHSLWNELLSQVRYGGFPTEDEWTEHCAKLVSHIHSFDPTGERFRYPSSKTGLPFELTQVEFGELLKAHWHIKSYCEAVISMFDASSPY